MNDGVNVPRQLTSPTGEITLAVRYNPWDKPIETNGTGNFDASHIGTLIDATTGLIYVGNGQYYDPETGRFLTRGANPNGANPYVPWNPIGMLLGPLALISGNYTKRRIKRPLWIVIAILSLTLMSCFYIQGCDGWNEFWNVSSPEAPNGSEGEGGSGTVTPAPTPSPSPVVDPPVVEDPCANGQCTATPIARGIVGLFCGFRTTPDLPGPGCQTENKDNLPTTHLDYWKNWAAQRAYDYKYYDYPGDAGNRKIGQADGAVGELKSYSPVVLIGFSAGGDTALIAASKLYKTTKVEAVVILDPGFEAADRNGNVVYDIGDFNDMITDLSGARVPVRLVDTQNPIPGVITEENPYYDYDADSSKSHWDAMTSVEIYNETYSWVYGANR